MYWNIKRPETLVVQGYTLVETILVLAIGIMVCAMGFTVIGQIRTLFGRFSQTQERIREVIFLRQSLDIDCDKSQAVFALGNGIFFAGNCDTFSYSFGKMVYRRNGVHVDSFRVLAKNIRKTYIKIAAGVEVISAVRFDIAEPVSLKNVELVKHYSSEDLMNLKYLHESSNY